MDTLYVLHYYDSDDGQNARIEGVYRSKEKVIDVIIKKNKKVYDGMLADDKTDLLDISICWFSHIRENYEKDKKEINDGLSKIEEIYDTMENNQLINSESMVESQKFCDEFWYKYKLIADWIEFEKILKKQLEIDKDHIECDSIEGVTYVISKKVIS